MPTYTFECENCAAQKDFVIPMSEMDGHKSYYCDCKGIMRRIFVPINVKPDTWKTPQAQPCLYNPYGPDPLEPCVIGSDSERKKLVDDNNRFHAERGNEVVIEPI